MRIYPDVLDEARTLEQVCQGCSLARYGDGEFALCLGRGIPCQASDAALAGRLRGILRASGACLVGVPNLHADGPKAAYWAKHAAAAAFFADRPFVSAFITRPDSAPWIDTPAYWARLESLWVGQAVTLVRGGERSLTAADLVGAAHVREIRAPREHAWRTYPQLLERILVERPTRVLLCLGPTATVAAVDLCAAGVQAVDLGHVGMFLKKHRRGEPMVVTDADKAA